MGLNSRDRTEPRGRLESWASGEPRPGGVCAASYPVERPVALRAGLVAAGMLALVLGAWLSVPFYPVPLTMQTLAVLVVGGLLGPRLGVAAVAGYLALGLTGAPVFHGGIGGPAVFLGPTGGYLLGFLPAVFLMGLFARRVGMGVGGVPTTGRAGVVSVVAAVAGALTAEVAIYALGLPWLALVYTGGSLRQALAAGLVPYLLGDALKVTVAVGALRIGTRALSRWGLPRL